MFLLYNFWAANLCLNPIGQFIGDVMSRHVGLHREQNQTLHCCSSSLPEWLFSSGQSQQWLCIWRTVVSIASPAIWPISFIYKWHHHKADLQITLQARLCTTMSAYIIHDSLGGSLASSQLFLGVRPGELKDFKEGWFLKTGRWMVAG